MVDRPGGWASPDERYRRTRTSFGIMIERVEYNSWQEAQERNLGLAKTGMNLRSADLLKLTLVTAFLTFALAQTSIDGSAPVQLPAGIVGNAYTAKVGNLSGVTYNVELVSGSLPPGLSFVGPELSGVPSSPGTFSFEVLLTNPLHPAPTGPPLLMTCNITIMLTRVPMSVKLSAAGQAEPFAPESIVSAYGTNLASVTASAATLPLPTSLDGNTVTLMDSAGVARLAPLFYVSPAQVNFEIPAGSDKGAATVSIQNQNGTAQSATVTIGIVSPGIFELKLRG